MDEISIENARPKLGDLVRDAQRHGMATRLTFHGKPAAMVAPLTRLTDADKYRIDRARALADAADLEAVSKTAETSIGTYAEAFGVARVRLGDLLAIIERLDAGVPRA